MKMTQAELMEFHAQELLDAHRHLTRAGIATELDGSPLTISQRCAIASAALRAWKATDVALAKAAQ